jgi:phosphatidylglycerophosphate synthase
MTIALFALVGVFVVHIMYESGMIPNKYIRQTFFLLIGWVFALAFIYDWIHG